MGACVFFHTSFYCENTQAEAMWKVSHFRKTHSLMFRDCCGRQTPNLEGKGQADLGDTAGLVPTTAIKRGSQ